MVNMTNKIFNLAQSVIISLKNDNHDNETDFTNSVAAYDSMRSEGKDDRFSFS